MVTEFDFTNFIPKLGIGNVPVIPILGVIILALGAYVFLMWKHRAIIFEYDSEGNRFFKKTEWVRLIKNKKGENFLDLFWSRKKVHNEFKPLSTGKKKMFLLVEDPNGDLHGVEFEKKSINFIEHVKAIPSNILGTQIAILHGLNQDYQNKSIMEKWGQYIFPAILVGAVVFMFIYGFEKFEVLQSTAAGLVNRAIEIHEQTIIAK